ncbi:CoA-disulfide reductase, partial [bacterium]
MHVIIIGGSDAGIAAALRAREIDPGTKVTVLLRDSFPNYSICGLPFFLSREVHDPASLAHRTKQELESQGVTLLLNTSADAIQPQEKRVLLATSSGSHPKTLPYDRLIIATGAHPADPRIIGQTLPGVYFLHTMEDTFAIDRYITEKKPRKAFIAGGGYIGLEMADALTLRGLEVTLASRTTSVLPTVDAALGRIVEEELRRHGVIVHTQTAVRSVSSSGGSLDVEDVKGEHYLAHMVALATGVQPSSELAHSAGIQTGYAGAIKVNRRMETNLADIFAAGDC